MNKKQFAKRPSRGRNIVHQNKPRVVLTQHKRDREFLDSGVKTTTQNA